MFSVPDFLDRAKHGARVDSDYALAVKVLGHKNQSKVSNWRLGKNVPEVGEIIKLCAWSGDDPEHVAACIQSMRAANDDAAELWRRVAKRLAGGGAHVLAMFGVAALLGATLAGWTSDASATLASPDAGVCILCQILSAKNQPWKFAQPGEEILIGFAR